MSSDPTINDSAPCPSCVLLQEQLSRLQAENESLRSRIGGSKSGANEASTWWERALQWSSWLALLVVPLLPAFLIKLGVSEPWDYVFYGVCFASPWMQWAIFFSLIALSGAKYRFRVLALIVGAAVLSAIWFLQSSLIEDGEYSSIMLVAPFPSALIAAPVVILSMALGWRLSREADDSSVRATSIASYLLLTAIVAALIAGIGWVPKSWANYWIGENGRIALVFVTPILAAVVVLVASFRLILGERGLWNRASMAYFVASCVFAVSVAAVSPILVLVVRDSAPMETVPVISFSVSWTLTFIGGCSACAMLLRRHGYRL